MNYKKIYDALIQYRKINKLTKSPTCYCESHHITPKCMNGKDKPENLINLTAREHYIAHLLLWKHYKDINPYFSPALLRAITCMMRASKCTKGRNFKFNSRLYENIKQQMSIVRRNSIMITNGSEQKWHDKRLPIPDGWRLGNSTAENRRHITNGKNNRCIKTTETIPDGWKLGMTMKCPNRKGMHYIKNERLQKQTVLKPGQILSEQQINDGWEYGVLKSNCAKLSASLKASKNKKISKNFIMANSGRVWVNDGKKSIRVYPDQIPDGYVKGRLTPQQ